MSFFHGVKATRTSSLSISVAQAESGITIAFGTAPVHTIGGGANEPIKVSSYSEAVAALGYSDDWEKYSLCEAIYSQFRLYGVAPMILVNVLDPDIHKSSVSATEYALVDGKAEMPFEVIPDTVRVSGGSGERGTDFDVYHADDHCIFEVIEGGAITGDSVRLSYSVVDPTAIGEDEIIGGKDTATGVRTGLELIDLCLPKFGIVPDIIIAPGYSHNPTIAAAMAAKCDINGVFKGKALIDGDCETVTNSAQVPDWKTANRVTDEDQILCWPMLSYAGKQYHFSTQLAGLMGAVDTDNDGVPSSGPSNNALAADCAVLADGTEVLLDLSDANHLNANGVVTALNWAGQFGAWGNYTACYPTDANPDKHFIGPTRMLDWIGNSLTLTYWSYVDMPIQDRLIGAIADSANIWINGLIKAGHLVGGRIEVLAEENPEEDVAAGKLRIHVYAAPSSPMQELEWIIEYDASYLAALFG